MYWLCIRLFGILAILSAANATAKSILEDVSASGFVSAGFASQDLELSGILSDFQTESERSFPFYESGLKVNVQFAGNLEFNAQFIYRDFENQSVDRARVDYASLDWRTAFGEDNEYVVSLGRIKTNGGIYNNTRDVPFTRPSIVLAQSVYLDLFRSIYEFTDGVRLVANNYLGDGLLTTEIGYGTTDIDDNFATFTLAGEPDGEFNADDTLFIDLRYSHADWLFNVSYVNVTPKFNGSFALRLENNFLLNVSGTTVFDFERFVYGVRWQKNDWQFTSEYSKQRLRVSYPDPIPFAINQDIDGYYLQGLYFINSDLSVVTRYEDINFGLDIGLLFRDDPRLLTVQDSKYVMTGLTWQFEQNWQVSLELHRTIEGSLDNSNLMLTQLSWRF